MSNIHAYYRSYDEKTRLTQDNLHYGEYHVTMHLLRKYLGEKPLQILDCCAGCGIYAAALADMGHIVTAGDLIPAHAQYMRDNLPQLHEVFEGNVCDLSRFCDESFDVVLNFGALYHLQDTSERGRAVTECLRVLRPGGIFAYTYQTLAAMILTYYPTAIKSLDVDQRRRAYALMDHARNTHCRDIFYGMSSQEITELANTYDLTPITRANTYPAFYPFFPESDTLSEAEFEKYLEVCVETLKIPCLPSIVCMAFGSEPKPNRDVMGDYISFHLR